jgi:hypothetical protein
MWTLCVWGHVENAFVWSSQGLGGSFAVYVCEGGGGGRATSLHGDSG